MIDVTDASKPAPVDDKQRIADLEWMLMEAADLGESMLEGAVELAPQLANHPAMVALRGLVKRWRDAVGNDTPPASAQTVAGVMSLAARFNGASS